MPASCTHLNNVAKALLVVPNDVRIQAIQSGFWIPYTKAKETLTHMQEILNYPRIDRMPNMLLIGPTNNGKSQLLKRFLSMNPPDENRDGDYTIFKLILVEAPSSPDIGNFFDRIFLAINQPLPPRMPIRDKEVILFSMLKKVKLQVLMIDEVHHLIAGGQVKQREFRNTLKSMSNILKISIIAAGVEEAINAFNIDPQLSNRFEPQFLQRWKFDGEFLSLLNTLERRTPLKLASNLKDTEISRAIFLMSEGVIGEIHEIIKRSAIHAIRSGDEKITMNTLSKIRWTAPSKRKHLPTPSQNYGITST